MEERLRLRPVKHFTMKGGFANRHIAFLGRQEANKRTLEEGRSSEAHGKTHLRNVAELTQSVGRLYGFSDTDLRLAYFSAWYHDQKRSSSEDPSLMDELISANLARNTLLALNHRKLFASSAAERNAVAYAIENQSDYPTWFSDPVKRNAVPDNIKDKLHMALFVADKIDANGARVIARRSSFVAGDRLCSESSDLPYYGYECNKDKVLVVITESMVRLGFINPIWIYPDRLQPILRPLYHTQIEFVRGLLNGANMNMTDVANSLISSKRDDGKNYLEVRNIRAPQSAVDLCAILVQAIGITDESIRMTSDDIVASSLEAVYYFGNSFREDLDVLVSNWQPRNKAAQRWKREMAAAV